MLSEEAPANIAIFMRGKVIKKVTIVSTNAMTAANIAFIYNYNDPTTWHYTAMTSTTIGTAKYWVWTGEVAPAKAVAFTTTAGSWNRRFIYHYE